MTTERDCMEYDVIVVGAGPAGLACAIRLKQKNPDMSVCVLEKASIPGAHSLAGAVIEPQPLDDLLPGWRDNPPEILIPVKKDEFAMLTPTGKIPFPTPPQQHNHGNFIVSLSNLIGWLAPQAEDLGVEIYPGFAATNALFDESGAVCGIQTGDMGVDKEGNEKPGFTQGIDIKAPLTIFAEGCRGSISKQLISHFELDKDSDPQTYGIGIKELWQLPEGRATEGKVAHSIGWPLDNSTYGGSFIYHLDGDRVAIGFVVGLDYQDPNFSPFEAFQQFKHHASVKPLLEGGEIISSGARALIEGGTQSLPKLEMPGAMLIGDAAGTMNVPKIKGVHTAMRSGMAAAEHFVAKGTSEGWDAVFHATDTAKELHKVRNIRPGFQKGLWRGLINAGIQTVTMGMLPGNKKNHADHTELKKLEEYPELDRNWVQRDLPPRDRLASVYFAATEHDEDQPIHLHVSDTNICIDQCTKEYGNPCTRFCPAGVYEMVEEDAERRLQINSANCVHCKTCDIKDPYQIINWVTPEGGSGPNYNNL